MDKITSTIERQHLKSILSGTKPVEYRAIKPYWEQRLEGVSVPFILRLRNGMTADAAEATLRIDRVTRKRGQFELHIGRVVHFYAPELDRSWAGSRVPKLLKARKPMAPQTLRKYVRELEVAPPITSRFERALRAAGWWGVQPVWYSSQKEHWLGWLKEYGGPGFYNRKNWNRTAEYSFNHIVCPPMLLWLCEACGLDTETVKRAAAAAKKAGPALPAMARAIRQVIPWAEVEECLRSSR